MPSKRPKKKSAARRHVAATGATTKVASNGDSSTVRILCDRPVDFGNDDAAMTFRQWCVLNGYSKKTGRRIRAKSPEGQGPKFARVSPRREIITIAENRAWLERCARDA